VIALRIVTLNTWKNEGDYRRRLELMAEGLAALSPDVVLLQEVFAGGGCDTAASLARRLGMHVSCFPARLKRRQHLGRQVLSTSGLAVLSRSRAACQVLPLSSHPLDGERIAVRADLAGGLRVLNLHLSHLGGELGDALRAQQLREALNWAKADWTGNLVVGGDLNAPAHDACLAELWACMRRPLELGSTLHGAGPAIDHLVLLGAPTSLRHRVLTEADETGVRPSDHCGVLLELPT
jgi:endonuclease/exonuclease/phosphatase family metal-dependent hydrolase